MMPESALLLTIPVTAWMAMNSSHENADHKSIKQAILDPFSSQIDRADLRQHAKTRKEK